MKPRWVIARKEFASIFQERTILLAVVIQVIVAGFSSFLVVGLSALVDPSSFSSQTEAHIALNPLAAQDQNLTGHLGASGFTLIGASSDVHAWDLFYDGRVDGAIFLLPPEEDADAEPIRLRVVLPESDLRATLTLVQAKEALENYERQQRAQRDARIAFDPVYVENDAKAGSYAFVYSLLIPLLVFLPVVLAGALCADSITEEVQRKTLPLLLASPATPADVVDGKLLANAAIAPLLAAAWFLLLGLNGLTVPPGGALAILVLATAIAYLMGLLACGVALATRDRNKAHVTYASLIFLLMGLSLALPVSPVNAVALLAAGSPSAGAYAVVAGSVALAAVGAVGLRVTLRRMTAWMAAGGA